MTGDLMDARGVLTDARGDLAGDLAGDLRGMGGSAAEAADAVVGALGLFGLAGLLGLVGDLDAAASFGVQFSFGASFGASFGLKNMFSFCCIGFCGAGFGLADMADMVSSGQRETEYDTHHISWIKISGIRIRT